MQNSLRLRLHLRPSPLWVIFEINFFRNLAASVLTAVLPLYFRQFVESDAGVGWIFITGYAAAFAANLFSASIIEHLKKRKSLLLALLLFTALFASFAIVTHAQTIFLLFAIYQFILSLFILDIGLYVKHYSNYREIAGNIGKLGSFGNIAWVFGPLLGSLIASRYGFSAVFLFSSVVSVIALITFFFIRFEDDGVRFPHSMPFSSNILRFFRDPNLRKTYLNNTGLGFIFSIWDYLPLLMTHLGASLPLIGMTKSLMGLPQAALEYPIGRLADKKTGERIIFIIGYALAALFTLFLGLTTDLKFFIAFFFIAAVGTSFLEMTRDSYFYRQIPEQEIELIAVYRTSDNFSYLIGQSLAIFTLSFLPTNMWFIIGGGLALAIFIPNAISLKKFNSSSEK